jgi:hypothetical protein
MNTGASVEYSKSEKVNQFLMQLKDPKVIDQVIGQLNNPEGQQADKCADKQPQNSTYFKNVS